MAQERTLGKKKPDMNSPFALAGLAAPAQESCCGGEVLVGTRLRALRRGQGLSIRSLAAKCGISVNTLSLIENNRTSPSVHTLHLLAGGLGVPLVTFFEEEKPEHGLVYQQHGQRPLVRFNNGTLEKLGEGLPPLGAEPILVTLDKDHKNAGEISHAGREFIYCLAGEVTCLIAGQPYVLSPGDSLLFDAKAPHRWANSHPAPAKLLVLFCPMEARDQPAERHLDY
ncbi:MAG: XRE family transcriptional regulator [Anaerolineaceae bacterium]|nr:MAG: XRE family transcriptional regulator [Anaerolineaceae bacterium]